VTDGPFAETNEQIGGALGLSQNEVDRAFVLQKLAELGPDPAT
jgi:hypothetical protein